jgi:hypothetical protein
VDGFFETRFALSRQRAVSRTASVDPLQEGGGAVSSHSRVKEVLIVGLGNQLIGNGQLCRIGFFPDHLQCKVYRPDGLAFVVLVNGHQQLILLDRVQASGPAVAATDRLRTDNGVETTY